MPYRHKVPYASLALNRIPTPETLITEATTAAVAAGLTRDTSKQPQLHVIATGEIVVEIPTVGG